MMKLIRLVSIFFFIVALEQAVAAVNINVVSGSRMTLSPGVDLVRQNISNLIINADQPYTVQLSDENGGSLVTGFHTIPYRVSYNNNVDVRLSSNPQVMESGAAVTNGNRTIAVTVLGTDTAKAAAGEYHATMRITVTAF